MDGEQGKFEREKERERVNWQGEDKETQPCGVVVGAQEDAGSGFQGASNF